MSILTTTSTGKNSVLDIYFFDKLGLIKCSDHSFRRKQNEYVQTLYTLGTVFIYMNDKNEFFYRGGKSSRGLIVKIFSRADLLNMVKTDMEYEKQHLSKQDYSYTLECYEKIYNRLKKLI